MFIRKMFNRFAHNHMTNRFSVNLAKNDEPFNLNFLSTELPIRNKLMEVDLSSLLYRYLAVCGRLEERFKRKRETRRERGRERERERER